MRYLSILLVIAILATFVTPALAGPPEPPQQQMFTSLYFQLEGLINQASVDGKITYPELQIFYLLLDYVWDVGMSAKNSAQVTKAIGAVRQIARTLKEMGGAVPTNFTLTVMPYYLTNCQMVSVGKGHYLLCPGREVLWCVGLRCTKINS